MLADDTDLAELEEGVLAALDDPPGGLRVLGHGEISLVLGIPSTEPVAVAKRLPLFTERARAEAYGALVEEYVEVLRGRGVQCVETEFRITSTEGGWAAYVVQPLVPPEAIGPACLRRLGESGDGAAARDLIGGIVARVVACTDGTVGLDGQLSNWALTDDGLVYFDVTTPLLADPPGRTRLDLGVLTSTLPWALRPVVSRAVAPSILRNYHSARGVLLDLAANLHKERLSAWVGAVLVEANRHVHPPITPEEARRHYRSDARTWELMLRLRMVDRWLHRNVLKRRYPTLLPPSIDR